MSLIKLPRRSLIGLTLCAALGLAACAPITIQIGAPSPTTTPTVAASPTVQLATDTPSPTPPPPAITVVVPPPQPLPPQQPTVSGAPAKPTDFKAVGVWDSITFTWIDNSASALGFRIYQVGDVPPVITVPAQTGGGGMSYKWTSRPCNFSAAFYIRAFNANGESASSNTDHAVTAPCGPPTNFTAMGVGNSIRFSWNSPSTNESGFHIFLQGSTEPSLTAQAKSTSATLTNLACNFNATYYVQAFNSAGTSPGSNFAGTWVVPCGPGGLYLLTVPPPSKTAVYIGWTNHTIPRPPFATGIHVYRDDVLFTTLPPNTQSMEVDQPCGTSHVYSLRAFNDAGESAPSEHRAAITLPC